MSDSGRYRVPSDEDVLSALARLGRLPLRRAFYAKLNNPHWVAALARNGAFRNPPETAIMPDGLIRSDPWPEIDYLVRMAPLASDEVADVLEPIAKRTNQWLRRGIAEAATAMEPADVLRLVPSMKSWPDDVLPNLRVDPEHIVRVIVRLLGAGHHSAGMQLAQAYLGPRAPKGQRELGVPTPVAGIESYWYKDSLHAVVMLLGESRLPTLRRWLEVYQAHATSYTGEPGFDKSFIWRPAIRSSSQYSADEIGDALVDEFRTALADSLAESARPLLRHLGDDQPLLRRIALDVLTEALSAMPRIQLDDAASLSSRDTSLVAVANQVLKDESYLDSDYRAEYVPFVRACLNLGQVVDVGPFFDGIRKGPLPVRDARSERSTAEGVTPDEADARREDSRKRWQHPMLSLVGTDRLPTDLCDTLAGLDEEYGPITVRDGEAHSETFWGPTSPLNLEVMRSMSDAELLEHLRTWHPEPNVQFGHSHEGQGRLLEEIISSAPDHRVGRLSELLTLRPTYIRHVVQGWVSAARKGKPVPWEDVLSLSEWVASQEGDRTVQSEGDHFDDDPDFTPLRFALLCLIDAGLSSQPTSEDSGLQEQAADRLFNRLVTYASDPEPSPAYEAQYGSDNMDPLTLSLNTVRPVAMRALIALACRFPDAAAATSALWVVDQHIGGRDPSFAVAAAVGEGTGRLVDSQRCWIEQRTPAIYGDTVPTTELQQVALSTALATHRVHPALISLLRGPLMLTIEHMLAADLATGWRTHNRTFPQVIGDWLVSALVREWMEFDDPLVMCFFANASAQLRGEVLSHLAWQLMRSDAVPEIVLRRAAALWDTRMEHVRKHPEDAIELSGAFWFARCDKYAPEWWLPRLEYASHVIPDYDMHGMVGAHLASAAAGDPDTALKILENTLQAAGSERGMMHYDLVKHAVPQVIARALDAGEATLEKRAMDLMNRLGARGHTDLKDRVEGHRASRPDV